LKLDWSTFVLEIINFLILVWLLKRFLYRPVLDVIDKRQKKIAAELNQAASEQQQAQDLKQRYETRLADWAREKSEALDGLEQDISLERTKRLQQLDDELEQQALKNQIRNQQQQQEWRNRVETEALQLAGTFAARLLQTLAGPDLDRRLQQLFIDQLATLPPEAITKAGQDGYSDRIEVTSAAPLDEARQQQIRQALQQRFGLATGRWEFRHDEQLLAGLRVSIGGWVLHANLRDELRFFSDAAAVHDQP